MEIIWSFAQHYITPFVPSLLVLAVAAGVLTLISRAGDLKTPGRRFSEQIFTTVVILAGVVGLLLTLPLDNSTRGQLLTLLGLLLTAVITLSSSTVAANGMAGVMLRSLGSYSPGDFIKVGDHFGRVTEQDLFHTEIQTEDRDLLTLPNLYLVTNPVKVVHASGTIVSAIVSLGYDLDHKQIDALLKKAATDAELEEPFVYVMELGDYSVTYRVSGFLREVKQLLSVKSRLHKKMMDQLHGNGIEIVSPAYMNQRPVTQAVIPKPSMITEESSSNSEPEKIIFDKADRAEQIKELRLTYDALKLELNELEKSDQDEKEIEMEKKQRRMNAIKRALAVLEEDLKEG